MHEPVRESVLGPDHSPLARGGRRRVWVIIGAGVLATLTGSALAIAQAFQARSPEQAVVPPAAQADAPQSVVVKRGAARPAAGRPGGFFTGSVGVDRLFPIQGPSRLTVASVTFEPGARTIWHSHPLGQTLVVTDGTGWVQGWGGKVQEIRAGDVVYTPPNQKHWHGATATTGMTHVAVVEAIDGRNVEAMEPVSDEQYKP